MEKLENIIFDNEDRELFLIDDLQLKADAIRNSILPKLQVVMNYAINQIDKVYNVNVFDDCIIAQAPHFRLNNRKADVRKNYDFARISIRGKRKYGKWLGIKKPNGDEPQLASFSLELILKQEGLFISLTNFSQLISKNSNKKVFNFLSKHEPVISVIQKRLRIFENRIQGNENFQIISNSDWLNNKLTKSDFDFSMFSDSVLYPIKYEQFKEVIDKLTLLYPVFHSYLQIAKGEKIKLYNLIDKANSWLVQKEKTITTNQQVSNIEFDLKAAKQKAELKIKVMPGIRWQVFKRDNWKCVACGRSADDGIILHVDHILPRSKGGRDEIDNYQTLCFTCNIGKSNKDDTGIRKSRVKN